MISPTMQLHINIAKLRGWTVRGDRSRYQLISDRGIPVGPIYRSPLAAWERCPRFSENVPDLLDTARKLYGRADLTFNPTTNQYSFTTNGRRMDADASEASRIFSMFILGLEERKRQEAEAAAEQAALLSRQRNKAK